MPKQIILLILTMGVVCPSFAERFSYRDSKTLSSDDLLFKENSRNRDRVFTDYEIIDASVSLGVSSGGCGQINVAQTLRTNLRNLLSEKTFQQMGSDLAGSSFMLLTCYWSPQLCSIMKSSRINSSLLAGLNFKTCNAINKYVDTRASDWELSKQKCFNKALSETGGDADAAAERCGKNSFNFDLADWAGGSNGTVNSNKLIESSAKWLGLRGAEAARIVDVTKAFVGDSVYAGGRISVDYGSRSRQLTPRSYYLEQRLKFEEKIDKIFDKLKNGHSPHSISAEEIAELNKGSEKVLVSNSTLDELSLLPRAKKKAVTEKLASTVAMNRLATDVGKSLDLLTSIERNPNLPEKRKEEIRKKKNDLSRSFETTVLLEKQKNDPVNSVLNKVALEGEITEKKRLSNLFQSEANKQNRGQLDQSFFNCADGFMCQR